MRHGSGVQWWAKRPWAQSPRGRRTIGAPSAWLSLGGMRARRARLRFARLQRFTATPPARQEQAARRGIQRTCHGHDGRTNCSEGSLVFCLDNGVHYRAEAQDRIDRDKSRRAELRREIDEDEFLREIASM